MSKLYFRYGAMGASKTANLLTTRFNYIERGMKVILLKPSCECRDGEVKIKSRIGLEADCILAEDFLDDIFMNPEKMYMLGESSIILIDECQFLEPKYIDILADIVDRCGISIICYGLKTDFRGNLFNGSKRLLELADIIEEIPTICWCGCKARFNARVSNGKMVTEGPTIELGGNESYVSLCRKHFFARIPYNPKK